MPAAADRVTPAPRAPRAPRAVAFDLDGTLIDSRADIAAACNHVLAWAGRPTLPIETITGYVGDGARILLARSFRLAPRDVAIDTLLGEWRRYYAEHPMVHSRWMPGAERALQSLAARGVQLALITNKDRHVTSEILAALQVTQRFASVYAGGDGALKPSPEPVLKVCAALGVTPGELWFVGDGVQDIEAAKAADARAIAVCNGFQAEAALRAAGPDAVYESLDAFMQALEVADAEHS
jgi:2-phosphoglycolate phosphatase